MEPLRERSPRAGRDPAAPSLCHNHCWPAETQHSPGAQPVRAFGVLQLRNPLNSRTRVPPACCPPQNVPVPCARPVPAQHYLSCGPSLAVIFRSEAQRGSWEANRGFYGAVRPGGGLPLQVFTPVPCRWLSGSSGLPAAQALCHLRAAARGHRLSSHGWAALPRCPRCSTPAACRSAAGS